MSDENRPAEPEPGSDAPVPPVLPGYPAYAVPLARPRFADQVMGMRSVVLTALLAVVVGGLGGFAVGHATGDDNHGFQRGPGMFQQRGAFPSSPYGFQGGPNQYSPRYNGTPQRRFDGTPPSLAPNQPPSASPSGGTGKNGG